MARNWAIFDDWKGGGFFRDGSYQSKGRYDALNMQRYANGSIGPRPQWRKVTQTADIDGSTIPTVASVDHRDLKYGAHWNSWGPLGFDQGAIIYAIPGDSKVLYVGDDGTVIFRDAANVGQIGVVDALNGVDAHSINGVGMLLDGSSLPYIGASNKFDIFADSVSLITPRVVAASNYHPTKSVLYRNRVYGWQPITGANRERIIYTTTTDMGDFNGGDSGDFRLTVAPTSYVGVVPHSLNPLGSGLLIFGSEGNTQETYTPYDVSQTFDVRLSDFGRWYILTGPNPERGTLTPLGLDIGPAYHSLSVVFKDRVLFPVRNEGWAVHDGTSLDVGVMAGLRPGKGVEDAHHAWYNPVHTHRESALILPFNTEEVDPTATGTGTADRIGEYFNTGLGAYEFVNGAWVESLYLHGQVSQLGNHAKGLCSINNLEHDRLFMAVMESDDDGVTYFPQFYFRDVTLNRPATSASQNTYNPYSDGTETAPDIEGGATGHMVAQLRTWEFTAPDYTTLELQDIVIDFDYWNSELFDGDCGFHIDIISRGERFERRVQSITTDDKVRPSGVSSGVTPKRARAHFSLPRLLTGSFQVQIRDNVGCAIHAIAVAYDSNDRVFF